MRDVLSIPTGEFVAIQIDLRIAGSIKNSMRFRETEFDLMVTEMENLMGYSTAEKKVEVRVIGIDGSIKDITFGELKPLVTY